jgi:hypothetical protein
VRVIAKYFDWQPAAEIVARWRAEGIPITLIPYRKHKRFSLIPDRAAAEYADPAMRRAVRDAIADFHPDVMWCDYTYLWPLYGEAKRRGIPVITRSINVESRHFLDEDGRTVVNYLKFIPKYISELITARRSDAVFAITPREEAWYRSHGAARAATLPLRALPRKTGTHTPRETDTLHIFFSGSTYTVSHNRRAAEFLLRDLAPRMFGAYDRGYVFHITGAKLPADLEPYIRDNVVSEGFVQNMDAFLADMDIAVSPSLFGAGMQQKIFEPLARGFPTITHPRGIAGYPFVSGRDFFAAETAEEYVRALAALRTIDKRRELSDNCKRKSAVLFSEQALNAIILNLCATL